MALVGFGQARVRQPGPRLVVRVNGIQAVVQARQAGAAAGEAQDVAGSDRREILGQTRARPPRWIARRRNKLDNPRNGYVQTPDGPSNIIARLPCPLSTHSAVRAGRHNPYDLGTLSLPYDSARRRKERCLRAIQRATPEAKTSRASRAFRAANRCFKPSQARYLTLHISIVPLESSRPANPNNLTAKRKMILTTCLQTPRGIRHFLMVLNSA